MQKKFENKAVKKEEKVETKQKYFFPDRQIAIEATSKEEAEKEFKKIINKGK